jgi:WD40 repeat protein
MNRSFYPLIVAVIALVAPWRTLAGETKPVSFYRDIFPLFKRSCTGCHHPGKMKGDLDLTTYTSFQKGGKHGVSFKPSHPQESRIIDEISGEEPSMPKEGDPLTKEEIASIERWILEGGQDDTPAPTSQTFTRESPFIYANPPVISALTYSPNGNILAIAGYHEVLLHSADGSNLVDRLIGDSPRVESLCFSPTGKLLAVCGGAPAQFGEIQIWNMDSNSLVKAFKITSDSLYGVSFSPDAERVAFGCADKTVRIISIHDGKELMKFDNHSDWVFGSTFTIDGKRLLTGSRDRAMKLIDVENGQFIDDINKLLEGILCIARHPKEDTVIYGGEMGTPRIYKISDNQGRTAANNDVNLLRELERQPGPIHAVGYSPDGSQVAVGGMGGEVRVYKSKDGTRLATLKGHEGAVFALAFHPDKSQISTGGFDGKIRIFDTASGELVKSFVPVPLKTAELMQKASK